MEKYENEISKCLVGQGCSISKMFGRQTTFQEGKMRKNWPPSLLLWNWKIFLRGTNWPKVPKKFKNFLFFLFKWGCSILVEIWSIQFVLVKCGHAIELKFWPIYQNNFITILYGVISSYFSCVSTFYQRLKHSTFKSIQKFIKIN